jgi:hypothetical protein
MTDRLTLYNLALGHLRERRLASLSENREPRRVLDDFWTSNLNYCLERKLWNFAFRAIEIDASTTVTPTFGFTYAFTIPNDWIRTVIVSADPSGSVPLLNYKEEAGYWFANITPLYIVFTSNDPLYGLNLGAWPASMEDYVAKRLAEQGCGRITGSDDLLKGPDGLSRKVKDAYKICSANCSMNNAPAYLPEGTWSKARRGYMTRIGTAGDNPGGGLMT